jgi:CheY-like chemotaxis protein
MSRYNILVLDDDKERLRDFKANLVGNAVTLVSTAQDAINQLKLYKFVLIFLDYDLDLNGQLDVTKTGTGMDVVDWIVAHKQLFLRDVFFVHSLNPIGGPMMTATLKTAGLRASAKPGVWKDAEFLETL